MQRLLNPTRALALDDLLDSRLMAQIGRLDLTSRKVFAGKLQGERRSKKRGESVEFADHRPYAVGDDLRHVDWNIYGRLDKFFLKLFMEEEDLSLHIVLDASLSADCGEPSKFLYGQQLTAALGYIGLMNLNRVAITTLGGKLRTVGGAQDQIQPTPVMHTLKDLRGKRRLQDIARFLCQVEPDGVTDFGAAAKRLAMSRRGKGIMVIISDFMMKEGYQDGLRMLQGRGYDVFAIQVLSPQEVEPDIAGDLRLRDCEDADLADVTISAPLLKKYKQVLAAYNNRLRQYCSRREMNCISVQSDTPLDTLILDTLRKRGLLR
ncbi:MAG: hypothetical protein ACI89L_001087 [Phycisphaerales bacterium]|jgi:uncharacterized protein (DUF58 family)